MILRDQSATTILVTCTDCPPFWALTFTLEDADRAAETHQVNVHGVEPGRAADAARKRATRRKGNRQNRP